MTFGVGIWLGVTTHYLVHKLRTIEPKWVEEFGQDYPAYKVNWFLSRGNMLLYFGFCFNFLKLRYYVDEQKIDPLNSSSMADEALKIYKAKRVIREIQYDKLRDPSFDFMLPGEDDIKDFDDLI